jgi:serine/threonine protein kinase
MIQNNQIQEWWNEYFPYETLQSIETPSGGATTQTFILNRSKLLKVYISKDGAEVRNNFFENTSKAIGLLDGLSLYSPKILCKYAKNKIFNAPFVCSEFIESIDLSNILYKLNLDEQFEKILCKSAKNKIFNAPFVCSEFIESIDLSNILYKLNLDEQFENGKKIGEIIKQLHELTKLTDQKYNTQILLDNAQKALDLESENNLLDLEIKEIMFKFVTEYRPRIIKTDFVLVHNDLHSENFLRDKDGIDFLIDFDMSFVGWKIFELRKLLYAALIPKYLVNKKLDDFYPNKSMIPFFQGLISVYPELFCYEYLDEIKLLLMPQGLNNLKKLQGSQDYDLTQDLFRMIFKENILETIF